MGASNTYKRKQMAYISLDDYALSVSHEELSEVLQQSADGYGLSEEETRKLNESKAEAKIQNFLSSKFDLGNEFSKEGTARNMALVGVYVDLTLCSLYRSVSPDDIPEMRNKDCEMAYETLMAWRDGNQDLVGLDPPASGESTSKPEYVMPIKFISKPEADPLLLDDELIALGAPHTLVEGTTTPTQVGMNWLTGSDDKEEGFEVRRSLDDINFVKLVIVPKGILNYDDSTVVTGTTYYYKVRAIANEGFNADSDYSNTITVVTP